MRDERLSPPAWAIKAAEEVMFRYSVVSRDNSEVYNLACIIAELHGHESPAGKLAESLRHLLQVHSPSPGYCDCGACRTARAALAEWERSR